MTRVYAADAALIGEYAHHRQLYQPIQAVPNHVFNAFLAVEEKDFYQHGALHTAGMARAISSYIRDYGSRRRTQGATTITQRVAGNVLFPPERSVIGAIREAMLARRLEAALPRDGILELYLERDRSPFRHQWHHRITLAEAAFLATLSKMPEKPVRNHRPRHRTAQLRH
ncbi:MAG: transglycosylase domain-containing protein [Alphaproteobacteria bacterium]|nr:transglycosylase domain-containing protein [Alphaproteobacteria bacterium]